MKTIEKLINDNAISRNKANEIVGTQYDLGGLSKEHMIIALGGKKGCKDYADLLNVRIEAYKKLDAISQFIVYQILDCDFMEEDGIQYHFDYIIKNLTLAKEAA